MSVSPLSSLTVLVVEDEPLVAMSIEDGLMEIGARIIGPAGSVSKAMRLIEKGGFDAALLDVNLRGERVDEVADSLAARGIPFVFTTGHGAEGLPENHRGRPVVPKPFDNEDLFDALSRNLAKG
jgi:CheY-like chemotaxis protein